MVTKNNLLRFGEFSTVLSLEANPRKSLHPDRTKGTGVERRDKQTDIQTDRHGTLLYIFHSTNKVFTRQIPRTEWTRTSDAFVSVETLTYAKFCERTNHLAEWHPQGFFFGPALKLIWSGGRCCFVFPPVGVEVF